MAKFQIGIVGGGVGGLTAAAALRQFGMAPVVFEQTQEFRRVGADINLTPNAVRALDGLGLGERLRAASARPTYRISRMWDTGLETSRLEMSDVAERRYEAPQLTFHRADLLSILESHVANESLELGKQVVAAERKGARALLKLSDGQSLEFDGLIGADGIHSTIRSSLFGEEHPRFTGIVAYRAIVERNRLSLPDLDAFTKWWGPDPRSQIVAFPLNRGQEIFVFATAPQSDWRNESWSQPGNVVELRELYRDFHPDARALLDACDEVLKTALYERDPLPRWSTGSITLLGDSCHPMMPFMAQGAAMAIEDAIVLARCLADSVSVENAFARYEHARIERASLIQVGSRRNEWLRESGDADWVYSYDAWGTQI